MRDGGKMAGWRVLVTGADTRIGRGVALEFARARAAVALHYPLEATGTQLAVDEIRQAGGTAEAFKANFNDIDQVRGLAAQAIAFLGGLDVLVNMRGMTEHTVYAGTKGAIVAFTRVLALELALKGVRVNAIAPGWILVENHLKALVQFDEAVSAATILAGFIGRPSDLGRLAIFLASDDARYIVGQTLVFDGGQMAILPNTGDFREPRQDHWGPGYVLGL